MPKEQKYPASSLINNLPLLPEFRGLEIKPEIAQYISECLNRMAVYEEKINQTLFNFGVIDFPLKIQVGPELEFYNIAGEQSFRKRMRQLDKAEKESSQDPNLSFEDVLAKDDSFMPKTAQHVSLNTAFFTGLKDAKHVQVARETAFNLQIATERHYPEVGKSANISNIAIFQHEIVSPPRSPYGLGVWLSVIGQRIIDRATEFGLKRSEIITEFENMSSSGLHMHISAIGSKDGKPVNILQRDCFSHEKGSKKKNPAELSQLSLHVAYAMNQFLKDYIYIFAPTNNAYERFQDIHAVGTSFIGFSKRRVRLDQGSAMFRGEGRETFRENDKTGKPDAGPLRIELRVPDVGCIGHPNKRAYQDQLMAPFDVVESLMYILSKGVESWAEARSRELKDGHGVIKTESALYEQRFDLPRWAGVAAENLREAQKRGEGFLTRARAITICNRGLRHQDINLLDRSPKLERGQTQDRSEILKHLPSRVLVP